MKRRQLNDEPPDEVINFDGTAYKEPAEWRAAYREWEAARRRWAKDHGIRERDLPTGHVGDEPWNPDWI
jgi:hypothetical protein